MQIFVPNSIFTDFKSSCYRSTTLMSQNLIWDIKYSIILKFREKLEKTEYFITLNF